MQERERDTLSNTLSSSQDDFAFSVFMVLASLCCS